MPPAPAPPYRRAGRRRMAPAPRGAAIGWPARGLVAVGGPLSTFGARRTVGEILGPRPLPGDAVAGA